MPSSPMHEHGKSGEFQQPATLSLSFLEAALAGCGSAVVAGPEVIALVTRETNGAFCLRGIPSPGLQWRFTAADFSNAALVTLSGRGSVQSCNPAGLDLLEAQKETSRYQDKSDVQLACLLTNLFETGTVLARDWAPVEPMPLRMKAPWGVGATLPSLRCAAPARGELVQELKQEAVLLHDAAGRFMTVDLCEPYVDLNALFAADGGLRDFILFKERGEAPAGDPAHLVEVRDGRAHPRFLSTASAYPLRELLGAQGDAAKIGALQVDSDVVFFQNGAEVRATHGVLQLIYEMYGRRLPEKVRSSKAVSRFRSGMNSEEGVGVVFRRRADAQAFLCEFDERVLCFEEHSDVLELEHVARTKGMPLTLSGDVAAEIENSAGSYNRFFLRRGESFNLCSVHLNEINGGYHLVLSLGNDLLGRDHLLSKELQLGLPAFERFSAEALLEPIAGNLYGVNFRDALAGSVDVPECFQISFRTAKTIEGVACSLYVRPEPLPEAAGVLIAGPYERYITHSGEAPMGLTVFISPVEPQRYFFEASEIDRIEAFRRKLQSAWSRST